MRPTLWTIPADCAAITLVLCFFAPQDPFQPLIAVRHSRCFFLTLRQEGLEGLVQGDGLVDLGTGSSTVGAETAACGIVREIDFRTLIAGYRPRSAIARSMTM